jgi:AraC-like DNA-binding protein
VTSSFPVDDNGDARIRIEEHGGTLDEARDILAREYAGIEWTADATDGPFVFRYSAAGDDVLTLRNVHFEGRLEGEMVPGDDIVIQWITKGRGILDVGPNQVELSPGRPRIWPGTAFRFEFEDYDQRLVQMNRAAVEKIAAEQGLPPAALVFDHTAESTPAAMQLWRNSISLISRSILDQNASPLLQAEMGRLAGMSLLELYPQDTTRLPPELLLPRNARLRVAVDYIHEHLHRPLSPADVAEAAGLSARGLQQAFSRILDITPHGYIRRLRLTAIHDELRHADPSTTSVADVALRWGFAHAGRFSAAYAAELGEYPKDTLRRQ